MIGKFKKIVSIALIGLSSTAVFAGIASLNTGIFRRVRGDEGDPYKIVLDNKNAVSTDGNYLQYSTTGGNTVTFDYTSVSASSGNHTAITQNGSIVNHDIIHSITSFTAEFTGTLQARIAYVTSKWGDYFDLTSGQKVVLDSHPYFLEIKASTNVVLKSATYGYNCQVNTDAEPQDTTGSYDVTFKKNSSDGSAELSDSEALAQVTSGSEYISSITVNQKVFAGSNGLKFGSSSNYGSLTITFNSSTFVNDITDIDVTCAQYGSDTGKLEFYVNGSNDTATAINVTPSDGSGKVAVNGKLTSLTIETSAKRAYLSGLSFNYGGTSEPGVPVTEIGFTASDSNYHDYTTNSVFDIANGISAKKIYSDGSESSLSKGSDGYSYKVYNAGGFEIDTSVKFTATGEYTLVVSYSTFIPVEITIYVGEYVYPLDISVSMSDASFTTAEKLSENLTGNLSVIISYSNGTNETVQYASFAAKKLGVTLLTPKGITYDQSTPFGSEGQWTVKVYSTEETDVFGTFKITVSAIPVTSISLNESSYTLYPNGQLQLVATVGPSDATNPSVYWTSNNEDVAAVDEEGLVTAVAIGGAIISANAADGSGVVGSCSITVVAAPATTTYTIDATTDSQVKTSSTSTLVFEESPVTITIAKGSSSTNANNYVASGTNPHTRAYNSQTFTISANGEPIDSIVIHGTSDKGINGFPSSWTNGSKETSGYDITITPTDPESDVYGTLTNTVSFSGVDVIVGEGSGGTPATPTYPTSIGLSAASNSISIGETSQLTVSYTPSDTNVKNVTYSSSNSSVATVSANGLVTGVSAGNVTITATAEAANNTTVTATTNITVKAIAVTGVSLNQQSASVKAGKTVTLTATVAPTNATNKNVTWSTSNSSVATVSGGVVTGVAAGEATITVTTVDGSKTATCVVTVSAGSAASAWELVTDASSLAAGDVIVLANYAQGVTNGDVSSQVMSSVSSTFSSDHSSIEELGDDTVTLTLGGSEGAWTLSNDDGQLLGATAVKKLAWGSGTTTWDISISGGDATVQNGTESYGRFLYNSSTPRFTTYTSNTSSSMLMPQIYRGGTAEPTDPTSIIMSNSSIELAPGGSKSLSVSYVPSNANQNKDVTWTSSATSVAQVSSTGQVTIPSTASAGQTATITAKLTNLPTITATCSVTIVEQTKDDHTVMIYMCGADLESGTDENGNVPTAANASGLASGDIDEILKVSGQPDDVNIIIETGGANIWQSGHSFSISNSKLERWHVEGRSLVKDDTLTTYASMGLTSTFQSFLEWGLNNYPAERTGVVLWNHGGGMHGVCYDEKKNDDSLLNNEVKTAVANAFTSTGRSTSDKLEWIGYDACLMSVQDIAEFNSPYFKYQVSSEESEAGYGWDYDNWVDNLYKKQTTTTILKEICDTFISDNGGVNKTSGDQTLSYLDLSYASAYKTAWENMAAQLQGKLTSSNKSSFNSAITSNVKHYADSDYDYFCLFDAKDFVNQLANGSAFSSFRIDSSYTTAVINAHANLVAYSTCQKGAGNSYGVCMYWPNSTQYSYISTYYTTSQTNFTTWQSVCNTYGTHR